MIRPVCRLTSIALVLAPDCICLSRPQFQAVRHRHLTLHPTTRHTQKQNPAFPPPIIDCYRLTIDIARPMRLRSIQGHEEARLLSLHYISASCYLPAPTFGTAHHILPPEGAVTVQGPPPCKMRLSQQDGRREDNRATPEGHTPAVQPVRTREKASF